MVGSGFFGGHEADQISVAVKKRPTAVAFIQIDRGLDQIITGPPVGLVGTAYAQAFDPSPETVWLSSVEFPTVIISSRKWIWSELAMPTAATG